jgi:hypothetical protein
VCPAGKEYGKDASQEAYAALMQSGLTFIDTAEVRPWVAFGAACYTGPAQQQQQQQYLNMYKFSQAFFLSTQQSCGQSSCSTFAGQLQQSLAGVAAQCS